MKGREPTSVDLEDGSEEGPDVLDGATVGLGVVPGLDSRTVLTAYVRVLIAVYRSRCRNGPSLG
jgi:hypothetical protein